MYTQNYIVCRFIPSDNGEKIIFAGFDNDKKLEVKRLNHYGFLYGYLIVHSFKIKGIINLFRTVASFFEIIYKTKITNQWSIINVSDDKKRTFPVMVKVEEVKQKTLLNLADKNYINSHYETLERYLNDSINALYINKIRKDWQKQQNLPSFIVSKKDSDDDDLNFSTHPIAELIWMLDKEKFYIFLNELRQTEATIQDLDDVFSWIDGIDQGYITDRISDKKNKYYSDLEHRINETAFVLNRIIQAIKLKKKKTNEYPHAQIQYNENNRPVPFEKPTREWLKIKISDQPWKSLKAYETENRNS